ncbi:MAG: helix-turn-helix domain-containing protein [Pseudomonas sp.]|nr:helix-turn-helix domain-containing protein [Pseudomonas sp.]
MNETSTHLFVPTAVPADLATAQQRTSCLGPDGAVAHVSRVIRMIQGRWKLPILFRLYADASMRTLQMKRDLPGISQKVLTQQLRELAADRLIERVDFNEKPLRVEYRLAPLGRELMPVLIAARAFSVSHAAAGGATGC